MRNCDGSPGSAATGGEAGASDGGNRSPSVSGTLVVGVLGVDISDIGALAPGSGGNVEKSGIGGSGGSGGSSELAAGAGVLGANGSALRAASTAARASVCALRFFASISASVGGADGAAGAIGSGGWMASTRAVGAASEVAS